MNMPQPWPIDWYHCTGKGGKVLWSAARSIGPISIDHNHWSGNYLEVTPAEAAQVAALPVLIASLTKLLEQYDSAVHDEYDGTDLLNDQLATADHARAALALCAQKAPT